MTHQHSRDAGTGFFTVARTLVCFACRYTAKATSSERKERRCPTCRQALVDCGQNFKAPRKRDANGWRTSEAKFGRGYAEQGAAVLLTEKVT